MKEYQRSFITLADPHVSAGPSTQVAVLLHATAVPKVVIGVAAEQASLTIGTAEVTIRLNEPTALSYPPTCM